MHITLVSINLQNAAALTWSASNRDLNNSSCICCNNLTHLITQVISAATGLQAVSSPLHRWLLLSCNVRFPVAHNILVSSAEKVIYKKGSMLWKQTHVGCNYEAIYQYYSFREVLDTALWIHYKTDCALKLLLSPPQIPAVWDSPWTWIPVCTTKWEVKLGKGCRVFPSLMLSRVVKAALVCCVWSVS